MYLYRYSTVFMSEAYTVEDILWYRRWSIADWWGTRNGRGRGDGGTSVILLSGASVTKENRSVRGSVEQLASQEDCVSSTYLCRYLGGSLGMLREG